MVRGPEASVATFGGVPTTPTLATPHDRVKARELQSSGKRCRRQVYGRAGDLENLGGQ